MTIIKLNKKYYNVPQHWNELTGRQLRQVMDVLEIKNYTGEQILVKLVQVLAGLNYWQFFCCKPQEIGEYLYLSQFLFGENLLTKQRIPFYDDGVFIRPHYGPSDELGNLRMEELTFSDNYFLQWAETKDVAFLNELVAVLYRPPKRHYDFERNPDDDPREPFNQNICSFHARQYVTHWPHDLKLAVAHWYNGCRQHIVRSNPEIFSGAGDPAKYGLLSVMQQVAKDGVLGNFDKVEKHYVNLVMITLNVAIEDAKQMEKRVKA